MLDKLEKLVNILKGISVIVFFAILSYSVYTVTGSVIRIESNISGLTTQVATEIPKIRQDLFGTLSDAITKINTRLISIESATFKRIDNIESKTFAELEKTNNSITTVADSIVNLSNEYSKIPEQVTQVSNSIKPNIDCEINDYCWPNLFSDLLIDSRNMVRDGSKTFSIVNKEIPKVTQEVGKISTSLSVEIPKITENSTKITSNIDRLTKPRWYDRILGIGANASLIYFNVGKVR